MSKIWPAAVYFKKKEEGRKIMRYTEGQKVTITNDNPKSKKSAFRGHTCRIVKMYPHAGFDTYSGRDYVRSFQLEWRREDNPNYIANIGKEMNIGTFGWLEYDFVSGCRTLIIKEGLPEF